MLAQRQPGQHVKAFCRRRLDVTVLAMLCVVNVAHVLLCANVWEYKPEGINKQIHVRSYIIFANA